MSSEQSSLFEFVCFILPVSGIEGVLFFLYDKEIIKNFKGEIMSHEVIINGVNYDAVDAPKCDECLLRDKCLDAN